MSLTYFTDYDPFILNQNFKLLGLQHPGNAQCLKIKNNLRTKIPWTKHIYQNQHVIGLFSNTKVSGFIF